MTDLFRLILGILASRFKARATLEAENLVLRQQVNVLRRRTPKRSHLNNTDRFLFVWLYRWFPSVLEAVAIVRPETIIRWHRAGFRAYWRWRSRNRVGRPKVSAELRTLIGEMSRANALWGAPRIHGELLKLGFEVAQSTVARYMCRHSRPPSQGWRTFLSNHVDGIAAIDLFVLPTIAFQILYCLVIVRHGRRLWVSFGVTANPTAEWISRQVTEAFPWDHAPRDLIRDRDTSYGPVFLQRIRAMGIRDHPIAPRSPWQNACVERLIGSIRRECLDHMIVFGEAHLRRILRGYAAYYNVSRTHRSLNKDAPLYRAIERLGAVVSRPVVCTENLNPNVLMMKSAQDSVRTYDAGSLYRPRNRRIFMQRSMRSDAVVIIGVRFQNAAQMLLAEDNEVIQTLTPDRSDQPFGKAILPR